MAALGFKHIDSTLFSSRLHADGLGMMPMTRKSDFAASGSASMSFMTPCHAANYRGLA